MTKSITLPLKCLERLNKPITAKKPPDFILHTAQKRMIFFPPNHSWWNWNWEELLNNSHMPWMNTKACHLQNNIFLGEDHSRGVHAPTHMLIASQGTI